MKEERRKKLLECIDAIDMTILKEMGIFDSYIEMDVMSEEEHDAFYDLRMDVYETRKSLE